MADCREQIIKDLKGVLSVEELQKIFDKIERRFANPKWDPAVKFALERNATEGDITAMKERLRELTPEGRVQEAARLAFDEALHEKREQLRRQYLATQATERVLNYITAHGEKGKVNGLVRLLVGDMSGKSEGLTLEARKDGILQLDMAQLVDSFDAYLGHFGYKMTDKQALDIAYELDAPGSSGDPHARKLAETWTAWADNARKQKNALGADIGFLKDWHLPQLWDPAEMRKFGLTREERLRLISPTTPKAAKDALYEAAQQRFVERALPRINPDKYLDDDGLPLSQDALRQVLTQMHRTISTNGLSEPPQMIGGLAGLAQSLGKHRELHFKSAVDWLGFNKEAGQTDILGIMQRGVIQNARDTALLEVFGPNPDRAFETALAWAKYFDQGDKGAFKAQLYYDEIRGTSKLPVSERGGVVANAMLGLRQWMVATKLGSLLLSQINDVATYAAIARTDGLGVGKAMQLALKSLNPASADDRKAAYQAAVAAQQVINDVGMRYGEAVKGVSMASRFANATISLSGGEWWTNGMKRAYQTLIGFQLTEAVEKGPEAMGPQFNAMLRRYGITEADWDIIRQAQPAEIYGEMVITPGAVKLLGDAPEIREAAIKLAGLMHEEADIAIVSPGAREVALLKDSTKPGTLSGEMMRSFALFKTFTVALSTKVLPRVLNSEGTTGFRAGLAAQFALGMIIAGGISYQLKSVSMGRDPRDMTTVAFWGAAAAQSGGMGILGDFLFADYNRFGHDMVASMAGPVGGFVQDAGKLTLGNVAQAIKGEDLKLAAESMQFVKNYTPLVNLWYTRAALDHLLFFQVQESMNPGYLRRMKSRVEAENNQSFWWAPGDVLPREAPDLGAAVGQ